MRAEEWAEKTCIGPIAEAGEENQGHSVLINELTESRAYYRSFAGHEEWLDL